MDYPRTLFDEVLISCAGDDFDLLRLSAGDQFAVNLHSVVQSNEAPIYYAKQTMSQYPLLKEKFFQHRLIDPDIPEPFIQAWIFDHLVTNAVLYRSTLLRPCGVREATELTMMNIVHLLLLNKPSEYCVYSGLADYGRICDTFVERNASSLEQEDVILIKKIGSIVADITKPEWLFYKPVWQNVFLHHPSRLNIFRRFLYLSLISYTFDDATLRAVFSLERSDFTHLITDFIALYEDNATSEDIIDFLSVARDDLELFAPNHFFATMLEGPFDAVQYLHEHAFGRRFDKLTIPFLDGGMASLRSLQTLEKTYTPEALIETNVQPGDYVVSLFRDHSDFLNQEPFLNPVQKTRLGFFSDLTETSMWRDGAIKDVLFPSLAFRRYLHFFHGDVNRAKDRIYRTEHMLLRMSVKDKDGQFNSVLGLSKIIELIHRQFIINKENLTSEDTTLLLSLISVFTRLKVNHPTKMAKRWRDIFEDPILSLRLRGFIFFILEAFYITPHHFPQFTMITKEDFRDRVRYCIQTLRSYPSDEDLHKLFTMTPMFSAPPCLTPWDQAVWVDSFRNIPDHNHLDPGCFHVGDDDDDDN